MHAPPTSFAELDRTTGASAPTAIGISVRVTDHRWSIALRDYLRRLGFCVLVADDGTIAAESLPGSVDPPTRDELEGYIDGWVKANGVPVQFA
jgi:hypothetical protein